MMFLLLIDLVYGDNTLTTAFRCGHRTLDEL